MLLEGTGHGINEKLLFVCLDISEVKELPNCYPEQVGQSTFDPASYGGVIFFAWEKVPFGLFSRSIHRAISRVHCFA